jgi:hypothetical protein
MGDDLFAFGLVVASVALVIALWEVVESLRGRPRPRF